ncbi:hypothetical protein ACXN5S_05780 [Pseudoroseicyclus sp. H15]
MNAIFDTLTRLSDELDQMPMKDMPERLATEILEQGGAFPRADFENGKIHAMAQFRLHGVMATAPTPMQAADLWRCEARTVLGGYDAPASDLTVRKAQLRWLASTPVVRLPPNILCRWATLALAISDDFDTRRRAARVLKKEVAA